MSNPTPKPTHSTDYEALLAKHEQSGLTIRAFAESEGLKPATLYAWRRKLRVTRRKAKPAAPELRRVRVTEPDEPAPESPPPFELTLGRVRSLKIPASFKAGDLRRLLSALEA